MYRRAPYERALGSCAVLLYAQRRAVASTAGDGRSATEQITELVPLVTTWRFPLAVADLTALADKLPVGAASWAHMSGARVRVGKSNYMVISIDSITDQARLIELPPFADAKAGKATLVVARSNTMLLVSYFSSMLGGPIQFGGSGPLHNVASHLKSSNL
jgi:hypothetical protein